MARTKPGMTQSEYARRIGKTRQYVNKLVKLGKIPLGAGGRIDPALADAALEVALDPAREVDKKGPGEVDSLQNDQAESVNQSGDRQKGGLTYHRARSLRENYRFLLTKVEYQERVGHLVRLQDVNQALTDAGRLIMNRLLNWPSKLAPILAAESDERRINEVLMREARALLKEFHESLGALRRVRDSG